MLMRLKCKLKLGIAPKEDVSFRAMLPYRYRGRGEENCIQSQSLQDRDHELRTSTVHYSSTYRQWRGSTSVVKNRTVVCVGAHT